MTNIKETKPFYLTSEFWLHAVGQLLLWLGTLPTDGAPGWVKTVISLALVASYGLSRGVAKSGTPKAVMPMPEFPSAGVKHGSYQPPTMTDEQDAKLALAADADAPGNLPTGGAA